MAPRAEIQKHFELALKEIGVIAPYWSEEDGMFVFEHKKYPRVVHAAATKRETVAGYKRALKEFVKDRLNGDLSEEAEKATTGHGGFRPGAGRPRGTKSEPKTRIYIPTRLLEEVQTFIAERA